MTNPEPLERSLIVVGEAVLAVTRSAMSLVNPYCIPASPAAAVMRITSKGQVTIP